MFLVCNHMARRPSWWPIHWYFFKIVQFKRTHNYLYWRGMREHTSNKSQTSSQTGLREWAYYSDFEHLNIVTALTANRISILSASIKKKWLVLLNNLICIISDGDDIIWSVLTKGMFSKTLTIFVWHLRQKKRTC